ncbi:HK97 family phage prohead protease [Paraeggerthella sp.]|uniref:HK97 family phage prohead protease n=1 Tax=Paraeggerthella sp. TaxID=2897350 RepID=UPI003AB6CAE7
MTLRNDSAEIEGYVNAVGRESRPLRDKDGYFVEVIQPGAFARALQRGRREMLLNHDETRVLGTEGDNLELHEDGVGLFARACVTDPEAIDKAKKRELRGWSFGFIPLQERWVEVDGMRRRYVEDMDLREVSILDMRKLPAYAATSVLTRDVEGSDAPVEYRTMDVQNVDVLETREEQIDYSPYTSVIDELKR